MSNGNAGEGERFRDRATVAHHANRQTDPLDGCSPAACPDDAPGRRRLLSRTSAGSGSDGGRGRVRAGDRRDAPGPRPRRLADVAPDAGRLGLQPAGPDRPGQRGRSAHGLDARAGARTAGGHAAGLQRRPVHAPGERRDRGDRRGDRRPPMGAPARSAGGRLRLRRRQLAQQPQHRDLRPLHHQHQRRQLRVRPRRCDRRDRLGNADLRLPGNAGRAQLGTDHRRRQGDRSPGGAAGRAGDPSRASSSPTTPSPARSCGGGGPCRPPASRATRHGAACRTSGASTSAPGCRPATTRNCASSTRARRSPRRPRSSCSGASRTSTSTTTRRWPSTSTPARSAGTTST